MSSLPVRWINHPSALADAEYKPWQLHHFAVAIHAHSARTRVDWRSDYDALTYTEIQCPADIAERAHAFLCAAGLVYGAFDFIVTPDTKHYTFLECNAAGQWGWLAEECGLPIAEAIADELTGDLR